ncbi:hypothetical protein [Alkanindiges illinoisensis]|nr:hypothetical protein [Alkanindiges illinoisensis]
MATRLFPLAGINNVVHDDQLQQGGDNPKLFVRDAVNVDISVTGRPSLRKSGEQVTTLNYKNLWQSSLHRDVFASLNNQVVKVNPDTWDYEVILDNVDTVIVCFELVNNAVFISTSDGIFIYTGGEKAQALVIDTPAQPQAGFTTGGMLYGGTYVIAISWLRGQIESGLSESTKVMIANAIGSDQFDGSYAAIHVNLPYCLDGTVTGVRVYITTRNGAALLHFADYPITDTTIVINDVDQLGMTAKFEYLSPMPSGKIMRYWQGRLLCADKNIIRFSQPMAYHLHDERHDFVMMPQRITFLVPVDGGLWVGQVDHVVFLSGSQPSDMRFVKKTSRPPVPNSAISLDAQQVGSEISQGGGKTALWLAENGYVLGTSSGQVIELHAGIMKGISAKSGTSVVLDRRIQTAVI